MKKTIVYDAFRGTKSIASVSIIFVLIVLDAATLLRPAVLKQDKGICGSWQREQSVTGS